MKKYYCFNSNSKGLYKYCWKMREKKVIVT
jgi:hypothetical protein